MGKEEYMDINRESRSGRRWREHLYRLGPLRAWLGVEGGLCFVRKGIGEGGKGEGEGSYHLRSKKASRRSRSRLIRPLYTLRFSFISPSHYHQN
jgi:hypothetical protein